MADENTLWIVADTEVVEESVEVEGRRDGGRDTGGGFGPTRAIEAIKTIGKRQRVPLDAKALKTQMEGMLAIVNDLFDQATTGTGLQLDEVELSVEINAEGQVSLVGNGGKLGNTGGITLKFVRPDGKKQVG
ncbi:MAG: hypothetical protein AAFW84_29740 [Cyanobacteria bacterium J06635_15]